MEEIFTKEKSNIGRQKEIDVAKALAIIFMVWVHVNEVYQSTAIEGGLHNRIIEFIGSPPAAPIFMMTLGIGIVYSKRSTASVLFKRGTILLIAGYVLNLIRDFIPYYLLYKRHGDLMYLEEGWSLLWGTDILPFAGLTFIFFSFVKKFKIKNNVVFIMLCTFITANLLLEGVSFENSFINGALRLIWGTDEDAWFPFLTWITFPIAGYFFGQVLIRCRNKDVLYKKILLITGPLSVPLWIYSYIRNVKFGAFGELYQTEYYHHDLMGNIVLCTFALFWISVCYFISKYLPELVHKMMGRWSRNTDIMYCVHWILIGYFMLIFERLSYMPLGIFILAAVIFIITDFICIRIRKINT